VAYSCSRQLPDGGWYYGEDSRYHWIDSFHTGYNLDSIQCYIDSTGDQTFRPQMDRGLRYFTQTFFEPSGRPKYYHNRAYPIDIQCAAQGIETLAKFAAHDPEALPTALRVAQWTIRNLQDASGYFYYRRYPPGREDPHAPLGAGHDVSGAGVAVADGRTRETIGQKCPRMPGTYRLLGVMVPEPTAPSRPRCSSCSRRAGSRSGTTWITR
jgi:hypothetical protein